MQKKCQRCGKTFTAGQGNYRYCDDCKKKCTPPKLVVEVATDNFEKMAESIDGAIRKAAPDSVKRPDHYTWKKKECREIQRDMVDGLSGMAVSDMTNIIKYLYRVGHKDDAKQDLDKAKQYINFLYEDLQRETN